jgi:DNA-binding CsgD family transcriptional regulator
MPSLSGVNDYRRLLAEESVRLEARQRELEDARAVIAGLTAAEGSPAADAPADLELVPRERGVAAYEDAVRSTQGPIRHLVATIDTVPAHDDALVRWLQAEVAGGRVLRSIYPSSFLHDGHVHEAMWLRRWADVGEHQRLVESVPHPFTVFGDELVLSATVWGAATADLLTIRSPVVVRAFAALFDRAWQSALPVPQTRQEGREDRLLGMLAGGLKDEAIARYLGVSLRTVRRRVAELMEQHGAQTRFQLGSALERRGLLGSAGGAQTPSR